MDGVEQAFLEIREAARQNEDIQGFVLTGSRGKGFENAWSDYDFALFVSDEALEKYQEQYRDLPSGAHLYLFTLDSFRERAAWGSPMEWERYTWARLSVDFDRTGGLIQQLLDEKGTVPAEHTQAHIRYSLNWFLNQVYHSIKCLRVQDRVAHRLEAAEATRPFLQALFATHERRLVPYYKYLRWELEHYPLHKLSLTVDELLNTLEQLLSEDSHRAQQKLLAEAQRLFSAEGFVDLFAQYRARFVLGYPTSVEE
ncbi:MAG: nucleotidyltransferase domain-containing protein [Ardenticatenales bacterium]|nr:nucleotidyltransferase domain-containing protein [Ardenticatenales bacterium]